MLSVIVQVNGHEVGRVDMVRLNDLGPENIGHYKAAVYEGDEVVRRNFAVKGFERTRGFWRLAELACGKASVKA